MFSESAELYDTIYRTLKNYAAEADVIAKIIHTAHPAARTVLDVGCGTGEHVKHLRLSGFDADGLDLDAGLLALARKKVPDAAFFEADMSNFELPKRYDVVACLFSAIGYLKTVDRVTAALRLLRNHLATDGIVIVEPWLTPGKMRAGKGSTVKTEVAGLRVERDSFIVIDGTLSTLTFDYRLDDAHGTRRAREVHELGLFTTEQMLGAFSAAGLTATFDPVGIFDNRGLYTARVTPGEGTQ